MFENMFKKALKQVKRLTMLYAWEKKADKDAITNIIVQIYIRVDYYHGYSRHLTIEEVAWLPF